MSLCIVNWAHSVDVWQHRPIYIEKSRMSPNYRKVCYAGWIDRELWSNFPPVEPKSAEYFKQAREFGPYSTRGKSEQYNPMNGCNPLWQEETALETGICVIDELGRFVGANVIAKEREQACKLNRAWELQEVAKWTEEKRRKAKAKEWEVRSQQSREAYQKRLRDADLWLIENDPYYMPFKCKMERHFPKYTYKAVRVREIESRGSSATATIAQWFSVSGLEAEEIKLLALQYVQLGAGIPEVEAQQD
jgi:hypothetical protein